MSSMQFTSMANPKAMAYTNPAGMRKQAMASLMFGRIGKMSFGQKTSTTQGATNSVTGQNASDNSAGRAIISKGTSEFGKLSYCSMTWRSSRVKNSGGDWCFLFSAGELSRSTQTRLDFFLGIIVLMTSLTPNDLIRDDLCNTITTETNKTTNINNKANTGWHRSSG